MTSRYRVDMEEKDKAEALNFRDRINDGCWPSASTGPTPLMTLASAMVVCIEVDHARS